MIDKLLNAITGRKGKQYTVSKFMTKIGIDPNNTSEFVKEYMRAAKIQALELSLSDEPNRDVKNEFSKYMKSNLRCFDVLHNVGIETYNGSQEKPAEEVKKECESLLKKLKSKGKCLDYGLFIRSFDEFFEDSNTIVGKVTGLQVCTGSKSYDFEPADLQDFPKEESELPHIDLATYENSKTIKQQLNLINKNLRSVASSARSDRKLHDAKDLEIRFMLDGKLPCYIKEIAYPGFDELTNARALPLYLDNALRTGEPVKITSGYLHEDTSFPGFAFSVSKMKFPCGAFFDEEFYLSLSSLDKASSEIRMENYRETKEYKESVAKYETKCAEFDSLL